jgi:hypothetical protein
MLRPTLFVLTTPYYDVPCAKQHKENGHVLANHSSYMSAGNAVPSWPPKVSMVLL